jgi:S-adenosylmethionine:tRNA ribosyltransferase-isomerase
MAYFLYRTDRTVLYCPYVSALDGPSSPRLTLPISSCFVMLIAVRTDELAFHLPAELIAQRPLAQRDASRLLLLNRTDGSFEDSSFTLFPSLLQGDELLVFNDARVLPARLFGHRVGVRSPHSSTVLPTPPLPGNVEVFLTRQIELDRWEALVKPGRKLPVGEKIVFGKAELEGEIVERGELGLRTIHFYSNSEQSVAQLIEKLGHVPLPPYIRRPDETADRDHYQTVFARSPVAVAAPTAGLHFTTELLDAVRARGCDTCELTLNVGLGTFQPVHSETFEEHKIHAERYNIPEVTVDKILQARKEKRPILAVGTTVVRALEAAAAEAAGSTSSGPLLQSGRAEAKIFLLPGSPFRVVDQLLTNFHLPQSTLLALVAAFAGTQNILRAYRHAVEARYRFYSYGDCMLIR